MNTTQAQQKALDDALVAPVDRQEFEDLPLEQDILSFIRDLGHTRDVTYLMESICYRHQQEDFLFQNEYKDAKKTNKMSYPRFTKIIIDYFMSKDQSILRRNKMFWHTARDDTVFTSMRCFSRHEDTQVYGTILPKELKNQAMLESNAYKTYYAFAFGEKTPKPKLKSKAKVAKFDKKKQPTKKPKAKGLAVLSEVLLSDGVDTQSKVPNEQQQKTSATDEGTGIIPGVHDVPIYESKSEKETWGDSEDEDDENDSDDLSDESDDDNDEEEEKIDDEEMMYNDEDDEVTKDLYEDVNVNLGNDDTKMTNVDQGASKQQNKTGGPTQSSSVNSDITSKLLNLDNPSLADNEITFLIDTTAQHATTILEITSTTTSFTSLPYFASVFKFNERFTNLEKDLLEIKQVDQEAINKAIQAHNFDSREEAQAKKREYIELIDTTVRTIIKEEVNAQLPQMLPQAISDVATPVIEKNVTESLEVVVLTKSLSQP
ncbi:hypothetical protein Tco_0804132 [Tanacetum coccineum]|uniref:Uncharacterized protein n=1 Tax=Tanacetum coccineum TaxID=301880 RepID=A0ABQ5A3I0_9ASTR